VVHSSGQTEQQQRTRVSAKPRQRLTLSSIGSQATEISAPESTCFCKTAIIIYPYDAVRNKAISLEQKGDLHKVDVIHPVEVITRQNQYVFYIFQPCILQKVFSNC